MHYTVFIHELYLCWSICDGISHLKKTPKNQGYNEMNINPRYFHITMNRIWDKISQNIAICLNRFTCERSEVERFQIKYQRCLIGWNRISRGHTHAGYWRWWRPSQHQRRTECCLCRWRTSGGSILPWLCSCSWLRTEPECTRPHPRTSVSLLPISCNMFCSVDSMEIKS